LHKKRRPQSEVLSFGILEIYNRAVIGPKDFFWIRRSPPHPPSPPKENKTQSGHFFQEETSLGYFLFSGSLLHVGSQYIKLKKSTDFSL
jgi:hypothetical protein